MGQASLIFNESWLVSYAIYVYKRQVGAWNASFRFSILTDNNEIGFPFLQINLGFSVQIKLLMVS